jgi:type I restriction enzyme M protein
MRSGVIKTNYRIDYLPILIWAYKTLYQFISKRCGGQSYEYLIKHFADLTNKKKKAGEFYTPRSVVHLLGLILDPHQGESVYDPCGTGGYIC